jgi:RNA polymerase sigma factor (TIGR02999 family)
VSDVTEILARSRPDDPRAAGELLPLVYTELHKLAAHRLAGERPGQTLQATALVHEAWLRLGGDSECAWQNRAHFFAAAAEAMRRILIDRARRREVLARGGFAKREEWTESKIVFAVDPAEFLAVHEALDELASEDPVAADLVKLRYFVGMTMSEAAEALALSQRSAERLWQFARAWLREAIGR